MICSAPAQSTFPSYDVFGAKLTPTTIDDLLQIVDANVGESRRCIIAHQNMHGLYVRLRDPSLDRLHQMDCTYVHIDGMPLIFLARIRGVSASRQHRVTYNDWIWPLLTLAAEREWRVYYLGAEEGVLRSGLSAIRRRLPGLEISGHNGFIGDVDSRESKHAISEIEEYRPQLLLVGMGMGRQEQWILANLQALKAPCICTTGACIEYIAGAVRTPPRWMGRFGLEWLFRLAENPLRFWYRYTIEPWFVLANIFQSSVTGRHGPVP